LSPSTGPATPAERDALRRALDVAWDGDPGRFACGAATSDVIDALADVVQAVVETDRTSAVIVAQQYRRDRCPGL
jgi:hypothetical protein